MRGLTATTTSRIGEIKHHVERMICSSLESMRKESEKGLNKSEMLMHLADGLNNVRFVVAACASLSHNAKLIPV